MDGFIGFPVTLRADLFFFFSFFFIHRNSGLFLSFSRIYSYCYLLWLWRWLFFPLACENFGRMFHHSFLACAVFKMEISARTLIPLFMPGSVHSGSASRNDCGRVFQCSLTSCVWVYSSGYCVLYCQGGVLVCIALLCSASSDWILPTSVCVFTGGNRLLYCTRIDSWLCLYSHNTIILVCLILHRFLPGSSTGSRSDELCVVFRQLVSQPVCIW